MATTFQQLRLICSIMLMMLQELCKTRASLLVGRFAVLFYFIFILFQMGEPLKAIQASNLVRLLIRSVLTRKLKFTPKRGMARVTWFSLQGRRRRSTYRALAISSFVWKFNFWSGRTRSQKVDISDTRALVLPVSYLLTDNLLTGMLPATNITGNLRPTLHECTLHRWRLIG